MKPAKPAETQQTSVQKWGMRWATLALVAVVGGAIWFGLGVGRRGQIGDAVQTISDGAQDASTNVQGQIADVRTSARNAGLEQKVSARLHGDKSLGAEQIEVTVPDEGTAILRGMVPDAEAKEKAVDLTRDTRGVVRVVDHLAVPPTPRVYDTREPAPAPAPAPAVSARPRGRGLTTTSREGLTR